MSIYYGEGRYRCEMLKQGLLEAKTGTTQIVWRFKVLETEAGGQLPAQYERTIYRAITENTIPYVIQDLQTLGYEHESFKFIDPGTEGHQDFTGAIFVAFCKHEPSDSGPREKWGIANTSDFEVKPLENSKLRQLDNMFGRHLKGFRSDAPRPATQRSATTVVDGGIDDSDIPF